MSAAVVAMAAMAASTPMADAANNNSNKKHPAELVDNFIDNLDEKFSRLDERGQELIDRIASQLDDAVERGQLNKVLNSERKFENFLEQDLRPFEKLVTKGERQILKTLDKRNADPALSEEVEDAVDEKLAQLNAKRLDLETEIADMIDQAIEDIENQID